MKLNKADMIKVISLATGKNTILKNCLEKDTNPQAVAIYNQTIGRLQVLDALSGSLQHNDNTLLKML